MDKSKVARFLLAYPVHCILMLCLLVAPWLIMAKTMLQYRLQSKHGFKVQFCCN